VEKLKVGKVLPEPKSEPNSWLLKTKRPTFLSLKLEKRIRATAAQLDETSVAKGAQVGRIKVNPKSLSYL
jgi:hypothetical protein